MKLRNGNVVESRFKEKSDKWCILDSGRYRWRDVVQFNIIKKVTY